MFFDSKSDISNAFLNVSIQKQHGNDFDTDAGVEFACDDDDHVILQEGLFMQ